MGSSGGETAPSRDLAKLADSLVVAVDAKRFRVEYLTKGENPDRYEYRLDGKTTKSKKDEKIFVINIQQTLNVIENGGALELTSHREFKGKNLGPGTTVTIDTPPQTFREVWRLQEAGKVLLIEKDGMKLVYDRP